MSLLSPIRGPISPPLDRALRGGGALPWEGAGGGGRTPSEVLDLFSGGTFTRSTEGSYLTAAPTDGSSAFMAWAAVNARRIENRGDGLGDMLLLEGARTNTMLRSRDAANAVWAAGSLVTSTFNEAGCDAAALAMRAQVASGGYSKLQTTGALAGASVMSSYQRRGAADLSYQALVTNGASVYAASAGGLLLPYQRIEYKSATAITSFIPVDGRAGLIPAEAHDVISDLPQLEAGTFPSSAIRTVAGVVTRAADVLSYAVGQYPASFLTRGFRITYVPDCSSAELALAGAQQRPVVFGAGFLYIQSNLAVTLWDGVVNHVTSPVFGASWSRGQALTITVEPNAGRLTLAGFTAGNGVYTGTAFSFASGPVGVGGSSGASTTFGRIGRYIEAL